MGRVFLSTIDDPFAAASREIAALRAAGAQRHLRGFPRRDDVREDCACRGGWTAR